MNAPNLTILEDTSPQKTSCGDNCKCKDKSTDTKGFTVEIDLSQLTESQNRTLSEIERKLFEIGISFDTGSGCGKRHWEWDWSLKGPIKIIPHN